MEEETVTITTPEPSPAPEPVPTPEPPLESVPALSEPEPSADPGMTVVSVDELIDRLVQSADTVEEVPVPEEPAAEEPGTGEVVVEDPVPGLIGDAIGLLLDIRGGMKNVESIEWTVNHPLLTTPFQDYTVTEGLLLLVLLCFFIKACMNMVRRAFSWLL